MHGDVQHALAGDTAPFHALILMWSQLRTTGTSGRHESALRFEHRDGGASAKQDDVGGTSDGHKNEQQQVHHDGGQQACQHQRQK